MGITIIYKTAIIYFFILIVMKFMGKREIGQLSLFDLVIVLIIADVSVMGIDNYDIPFYYFLLAIILLAVIQKILAILLLRFPKLRQFFDGKESFIIIDGKVNIKEMKKQNYNFDDLIVQMRLKNIRSLSEVKYLILEANGEISIFKNDDFDNLSVPIGTNKKTNNSTIVNNNKYNKDMIYPLPLILSGKICKENLKLLNLSEEWLLKEIKKKGYSDYKEVYYANFENNGIFILDVYKSK